MYKRFAKNKKAFTLPTVMIASLIMLAMLAGTIQLTLSTSNSLAEQRYGMLARTAAESGAVRALDCIRQGIFVAESTLTPATKCDTTSGGTSLYILNNSDVRTTYKTKYTYGNGGVKQVPTVGIVEKLKPDGSVSFTRSYSLVQQTEPEMDAQGMRATRRWWYFGTGVIDFGVSNATSPVVKSNPFSSGGEGTTVITNKSGELQFFSNGLTIWNREGQVMLDAGGLNGSSTATQAVVAFPMDANETKYVVVSNTASVPTEDVRGTLYYSVVDMKMDGGKGAVVSKNNVISGTESKASEALAAVANLTGTGYWVYTYNPEPSDNSVIGFEIKMSGSMPTVARSVKTPITVNKIEMGSSPRNGYGTINFSPDFSKVLVYMGGSIIGPSYTGSLHLFDIDLSNGQLRNDVSWLAGTSASKPTSSNMGYSADFSPSGRFVYSTQLYPGRMYRYDVSSENPSTIKNSEQYVGFTNCTYVGNSCDRPNSDVAGADYQGGGQVLRGPDGRMYVANWGASAISVVDNPDSLNLSDIGWHYNGLALPAGSYSYYGLPQMVTIYSPKVTLY